MKESFPVFKRVLEKYFLCVKKSFIVCIYSSLSIIDVF